jgi:hypothetical protein
LPHSARSSLQPSAFGEWELLSDVAGKASLFGGATSRCHFMVTYRGVLGRGAPRCSSACLEKKIAMLDRHGDLRPEMCLPDRLALFVASHLCSSKTLSSDFGIGLPCFAGGQMGTHAMNRAHSPAPDRFGLGSIMLGLGFLVFRWNPRDRSFTTPL